MSEKGKKVKRADKNQKNFRKEEVKVAVQISKDTNAGEGISGIKREWSEEEQEWKYKGYLWEVWEQIADKIEHKFKFKYSFT